MPIQYALRENRLTPEPDDYIASVTATRTVVLKDVIDRMVAQGSSITSADILSVFDNFEKALESLLSEGANVNLPFANFSSSIKGTFNGAGDSFDSSRHQITSVINAGSQLRQAYSQGFTAKKMETVEVIPHIVEYVDLNTGDRNSTMTTGGMGQISGHRLKFDAEDEAQGIFLIDNKNQAQKVSVIGENKPSRLMFLVPADLTQGDTILEVRANISNQFKVGRFSQTLTVTKG